MNETCKMLFKLSEAFGGSGAENNVIDIVKGFFSENWKTKTDSVGNLLVEVKKPQPNYPNVLFDAHIDEIGMIVTEITDEGFLRVAPCGGIDRKWLPAQEVTVFGKEPLLGVVCAVAPHLKNKEDDKIPEWNDILIDIGFSKEEAQKMVALGDRVCVVSPPILLGESIVSGKSIDNRAGAAAILLAAKKLQDIDCKCGISLLFSVQEELGCRGAAVGAFDLFPDIAISVDVSFAKTIGVPDNKSGKMKDGPMIGVSPALTKWISDKLIDVAKENDIPYQIEVMGGATSTNADYLGLTKSGIATGLCSIPERYMHIPVEATAISDVENTAKLLAVFASSLGKKQNYC